MKWFSEPLSEAVLMESQYSNSLHLFVRVAEMGKSTIRNFIGKVHIEDGSMGNGCILVVDDARLGNYPIASINIPFKTQKENNAVAEYLADAWNNGIK